MTWKRLTGIIIGLSIASLAVYDVVAYTNGGIDATISHVVNEWATEFPIFAFALGVLVGHFFWPIDTKK